MLKQKFKYINRQGIPMPYLPIRLINKSLSVEKMALVDSGSTISVIPYQLGIDLGFAWQGSKAKIPLSGNLARSFAIPVLLNGIVGNLEPVELGFAWASSDTPVILGQINFFQSFHICFYRDEEYFELTSKL